MEFSNDIIRSLGMTLVHSLWQGAIIAVIMTSLLSLIGKSNARLRYVVLYSGLMLLLTGFIVTLILVYQHSNLLINWKYSSQQPLLPPEYAFGPLWSLTPGRLAGWLFNSLEPVYPALALGWLAGFLFIGFRVTGGAVLARVNLRKSLMNPDASMQDTFDHLRNLLKLPVIVRLRITTRTISPMVIGLIKPMVVIPVAAITGLSASQIETVMFHELAHIRRFDHFLIILQVIAEQVLFFNPTAWFLLREINLERENCCDDFVVKTNNNPINYIKALTMIQEMNLQSNVPANAITGKSNQLLNRVRRLVKPELKHSPSFRLVAVFLFFATVGVSALTLLASGKPDDLFRNKDKTGNMLIINDLKSDPNGKVVMNGTISKVSSENRDGNKKKMKIVFLNDTIKEMTINGKEITKEEMKNYEDEIRKIRQEMEASQKELEKAHQELEETQKELQLARQQNNQEQLNKLWQTEEFQAQMKKVQEEAGRASMGMPLLPETEIMIPEVPEVEELIPLNPLSPAEMLPEEPAAKDSQDSESLNSKLKKLEEGEQ